MVFGMKTCIFVALKAICVMSKEIFEISVFVDEKFDMSFNLIDGIFGFLLRILGK
ncbi:hypothetical protein ACVWYN_003727 [Pedobacter sp. UYP24]